MLIPVFSFGQFTEIPDKNFEQALIDLYYDNVIDGKVITANISNVDSLDVSWYEISDLTGIEAFDSLTKLYCHNNKITSLDVSNNTALTYLHCFDNQLKTLDVSKNTALKFLLCSVNKLTTLDVSKNTSLTYLECWYNNFDCDALKAKYIIKDTVDVWD